MSVLVCVRVPKTILAGRARLFDEGRSAPCPWRRWHGGLLFFGDSSYLLDCFASCACRACLFGIDTAQPMFANNGFARGLALGTAKHCTIIWTVPSIFIARQNTYRISSFRERRETRGIGLAREQRANRTCEDLYHKWK